MFLVYRGAEDDPDKPLWVLPARRTIGSQVFDDRVGRVNSDEGEIEDGGGGGGGAKLCWHFGLQKYRSGGGGGVVTAVALVVAAVGRIQLSRLHIYDGARLRPDFYGIKERSRLLCLRM